MKMIQRFLELFIIMLLMFPAVGLLLLGGIGQSLKHYLDSWIDQIIKESRDEQD